MRNSYEVNVCRMRCVWYDASSLRNRLSAFSGHVVATSERFKVYKKKPQLHRCENLRNLTGYVGLGNALIPTFKLMSVTKWKRLGWKLWWSNFTCFRGIRLERTAKKCEETKNKKCQSWQLMACRDSDPGLLSYGAISSPLSVGAITMNSRQLLCIPNSFDMI